MFEYTSEVVGVARVDDVVVILRGRVRVGGEVVVMRQRLMRQLSWFTVL